MERIYGEKNITLPYELFDPLTLEPFIPKISEQKLKEIYAKLKPIVEVNGVKYLIKKYALEELRRVSCINDFPGKKIGTINQSKLEPIGDFLCLHKNSNVVFYPTIEEILAQVPDDYIEQANLVEIVEMPTSDDDFHKYPELSEKGFQLSKVRAYNYHK